MGWLSGVSTVWHMVGTVTLIILLPAVAPTHQSAKYVFTEFDDWTTESSGITNNGCALPSCCLFNAPVALLVSCIEWHCNYGQLTDERFDCGRYVLDRHAFKSVYCYWVRCMRTHVSDLLLRPVEHQRSKDRAQASSEYSRRSEETKGADRSAPIAILLAIGTSAVFGLGYLLALLFSIQVRTPHQPGTSGGRMPDKLPPGSHMRQV